MRWLSLVLRVTRWGEKPIKPAPTANAKRNNTAWRNMTTAERLTGMTPDELRLKQQRLKAEAQARREAA